jgi:hypothetical protein
MKREDKCQQNLQLNKTDPKNITYAEIKQKFKNEHKIMNLGGNVKENRLKEKLAFKSS